MRDHDMDDNHGTDDANDANQANDNDDNLKGLDGRDLGRMLRTALTRAFHEAKKRGSHLVEAEHILLALSTDRTSAVSKFLEAHALDHESIVLALATERKHSLAIAGVVPIGSSRLVSTPHESRPGWGASAKDVLVRSHRVSVENGRRQASDVDVLIGILQAPLGTVPRALELAGIDRPALIKQALT